jgi:hypothetical protein
MDTRGDPQALAICGGRRLKALGIVGLTGSLVGAVDTLLGPWAGQFFATTKARRAGRRCASPYAGVLVLCEGFGIADAGCGSAGASPSPAIIVTGAELDFLIQ